METNNDPLVKKPAMAKILAVSLRTVDNYMNEGCPYQKPSPRKVTFDVAEVMTWYKAKYGQQKRKSFEEQKSLAA